MEVGIPEVLLLLGVTLGQIKGPAGSMHMGWLSVALSPAALSLDFQILRWWVGVQWRLTKNIKRRYRRS
jgi:hypothetical protein